jgi:hypothetical protein
MYTNFYGEAEAVKISSIEIKDIYRSCEQNGDNYRDTTLQTTVNVKVKKSAKFSKTVLGRNCALALNSEDVEGFSLNKIPTPNPYVEGIEDSGLHMVTGGELTGDKSGTLTFCCQGECDTFNVNVC